MSVDPRPAPPVHPSRRPVVFRGLSKLLGLGDTVGERLTPQVQMGIALAALGKPTYAGTVPHDEKQRRRAAGRRARAARRVTRGRS